MKQDIRLLWRISTRQGYRSILMPGWQMPIPCKGTQRAIRFVFSDADKDWYKNYFIDVDPKLKVGGCFTSHNISDRSMGGSGGRGGDSGQGAYLEYVRSLKNYETTVNSTGGGVSISYKKG